MIYDSSTIYWTNKKGQKILVNAIPYKYLVNIMGYLLKFPDGETTEDGRTKEDWLHIISKEMALREKARQQTGTTS